MIGHLPCELTVVYLFNIWHTFKDKNPAVGIKLGHEWAQVN